MTALYRTTVTSTGPRRGTAVSSDGRLRVELDVPTELGGRGAGTDPEQLFGAGYAACFHSALTRVARAEGVSTKGSQVSAHVALIPLDGDRFGIEVDLEVWLPEVRPDTAQVLVERAHQVCPYSNATRGNIRVGLSVTDQSRLAS